ncbi:hypothetical protein LO762_29700 [Actinocorallia sp. API 0066]|uniref:WD40 repeat domain-containing protein n=1 Tax=Actinocorallia sp. API 0066 TaxID=2896846 RepID=UPI001E557030|nr:hypothetical protein [Actinocorallia sp. API 0066]MCD0453325.1 hypothetical protein [Actinocorallia sp. API 0066]
MPLIRVPLGRVSRRTIFRIGRAVVALLVVGSVTAFTLRTDRMGLEFATGTAWLQSRQVEKIMLVDGVSGAVTGSVRLDAVRGAEAHQSADPLFVWQGGAPDLGRIDARRLAAADPVPLPAPPSRVVGATDGTYAFFDDGPPRYVPRADPAAHREVRGFTGRADAVVVDDWGELWALSLATRRVVPVQDGVAGEPVRWTASGSVDLVVHDGEAALFDPAEGVLREPRTGRVTRLPVAGSGLLPVADTSSSFVAVFAPPRTLIVDPSASGSGEPKTVRVELGDATTHAGHALRFENRIYVPDLPSGRLLVYDLLQGKEADPIQITDKVIVSEGFEMFRKDDMLWVNEIDGPNALVIRDGEHRLIRKYEEPERPLPPTGTVSPLPNPPTSRTSAPPSPWTPPSSPPPSVAASGTATSTPPVTTPPQHDGVPAPSPRPESSGAPEGAPSAVPEPVPTPGDAEPSVLGGPAGALELRFRPDGRALAVASVNQVTVWDVGTGKPLGTLPGAGRPIAYSPDGTVLATGSTAVDGYGVIRFDARTLRRTTDPLLEGADPLGSPVQFDILLSYAGGGRFLVGGGGPRGNSHDPTRIVSWDLARPAEHTLIGLSLRQRLRSDRAGTRLLRVGFGTASVVPLTGGPLPTGAGLALGDATDAAWTGNSARVATVGTRVAVRSATTGATVASFPAPPGVTAIAANGDGSVVALHGGGAVTFWATATGQRLGEPVTGYQAQNGFLPLMEFSPDGKTLVLGGSPTGAIWMVEVPRG